MACWSSSSPSPEPEHTPILAGNTTGSSPWCAAAVQPTADLWRADPLHRSSSASVEVRSCFTPTAYFTLQPSCRKPTYGHGRVHPIGQACCSHQAVSQAASRPSPSFGRVSWTAPSHLLKPWVISPLSPFINVAYIKWVLLKVLVHYIKYYINECNINEIIYVFSCGVFMCARQKSLLRAIFGLSAGCRWSSSASAYAPHALRGELLYPTTLSATPYASVGASVGAPQIGSRLALHFIVWWHLCNN